VSGNRQDISLFKPPSLRNSAVTEPSMHDGSIATLAEVVVGHDSRGGPLIGSGTFAGDGSKNPLKSGLLLAFL
jgi:cytochrome c peroxidase